MNAPRYQACWFENGVPHFGPRRSTRYAASVDVQVIAKMMGKAAKAHVMKVGSDV